ncbi:MAG TPA: deoxyribose-phosphate aldolase [Thermoguttaceae bacterium]|jgi:deoxyribose-phosphate aldolase|nr:deoxyribose-phosphate aldolase [Thermoguttaceae bacterium]HPP52246.1 deoxyribose-phosphate aldolase [Thermoguttaceae bacterium]
MDYTFEQIAKMIDHSLLRPTLTVQELEQGIRLARRYEVASVCILPYYVSAAAERLADSGVLTTTTVGFPHGGHTTAVKLAEARQALDDGAVELDMVVNLSKVLSEDWTYVADEIRALVELVHSRNARLKVIFENCYLQQEHKIRLCEICGRLEVDWVKTSTGYGPGGATLEDLRLMRRYAPAHVQIKAAGGVRDLDALLAVRAVGATRVGATRTADILDECRRRLGLPPLGD